MKFKQKKIVSILLQLMKFSIIIFLILLAYFQFAQKTANRIEEPISRFEKKQIDNMLKKIPNPAFGGYYDSILFRYQKLISGDRNIYNIQFSNINKSESTFVVKKFNETVKNYGEASMIWPEKPALKGKETEITGSLNFQKLNNTLTIEQAIKNNSKSELETAIDYSREKLEIVLKLLLEIENTIGEDIYNSNKIFSPRDIKGRTYFQLGRLYLIKEILNDTESNRNLMIAYKYFNSSKELNFLDAELALDYIKNELKFNI